MTFSNNDNFRIYFYEKLASSNNWQSFSSIAKYLNTLKANRRFLLLSLILSDKENKSNSDRVVASGLTIELDARCPISLQDSILLVVDNLYASDREYPFFIAYQFGRDKVLAELNKMQHNYSFSPEQIRNLATFEYWVGGYSLERYQQLKKSWSDRIRG